MVTLVRYRLRLGWINRYDAVLLLSLLSSTLKKDLNMVALVRYRLRLGWINRCDVVLLRSSKSIVKTLINFMTDLTTTVKMVQIQVRYKYVCVQVDVREGKVFVKDTKSRD